MLPLDAGESLEKLITNSTGIFPSLIHQINVALHFTRSYRVLFLCCFPSRGNWLWNCICYWDIVLTILAWFHGDALLFYECMSLLQFQCSYTLHVVPQWMLQKFFYGLWQLGLSYVLLIGQHIVLKKKLLRRRSCWRLSVPFSGFKFKLSQIIDSLHGTFSSLSCDSEIFICHICRMAQMILFKHKL